MRHDLIAIRRKNLAAACAVVLTAALAAGCGAASTGEGSSAAQPSSAERHDDKGFAVTKRPTTDPTSTTSGPSDAQLIAYTATLHLRVRDVGSGSGKADAVVTAAGGYVEQQQADGERPASAYTTTTYRVPSAKYRTVLTQLGKLGTRVSLNQRADNVTEDVADVGARVKSAQASLDRLRTLMKHATDVKDVLSIEAQVSQRESELEALQARQRTLDKQVRYATVTLQLTGPRAVPPKRHDTGLLAGLRAGWHGLVAFVTGLLTVVGAVLPFLLIVGPLGAGGYLVWRRRRRRAAAAASS